MLNRYYKTAKKFEADTIVRITADGVLADPKLIDEFIRKFNKKNRLFEQPATYFLS